LLGLRKVVGTDITQIAVKNLKKKFPKDEFYQLDIGDNNVLLNEKFEIVSAFDVLYHIVDDVKFNIAIKNIYDLLKHDGLFIFSDIFLRSKTMRAENMVSRSLLDVENILKKTGFKIVKRSPQFVLMNNPIKSNSKLRRFFWKETMLYVKKSEVIGFIVGAILYPFEIILTNILKESPTTEIIICKKE